MYDAYDMVWYLGTYVIVPGWDGSQEKDMSGAPLCLYQAGLAKACWLR